MNVHLNLTTHEVVTPALPYVRTYLFKPERSNSNKSEETLEVDVYPSKEQL